MAKKKRSKLKKALKVLGAGAALAGLGRAFMNRNARASTNADAIKAMTQDSAYSLDEMPKGVDVLKSNVDVPMNLGRMTGQGDMGGATGQNIRAAYAQKMRNLDADIERNNMLRAIRADVNPNNRVMVGRGNFAMKKGGRVKKGGRAVRKANRSKKK